MNVSLRYADPETAAVYPLDCGGQIDWQSAGDVHRAMIPLAEVAAGTILVPSIALLGGHDYRWQFTLRLGTSRWALQPIPCGVAPSVDSNPAVTTHIDCFHVHQTIRDACLELEIVGLSPISRYLLTVTARALECLDIPPPGATVACAAPPAISQLSMGEALGPRICSPTCTTMVLAGFGKQPDLAQISAACFDAASNLYGIWPLALRAASDMGCVGAVEVFADWRAPQRVIAAGLPVIASIRFGLDGLPGSPLRQTAGHLVVVYGIGREQVLVCDPAAPDSEGVLRSYDTPSFARAWFQHRGAAYILLP